MTDFVAAQNVSVSQNDFSEFMYYVRLSKIALHYQKHHGILSFTVCIVGLLLNAYFLSLIVLVSSLRNSVNVLLSGVASCNILLMVFYSIFSMRFHIMEGSECDPLNDRTYAWAVFCLIHAISSITLHGTSVYITIYLGIMRVFILKFPYKGQISTESILRALGVIAVGVGTACLPNYLSVGVVSDHSCMRYNLTEYVVGKTALAERFPTIPIVGIWSHGTLLQAIPCTVLTVTIFLLMFYLRQVKRRRESLLNKKDRTDFYLSVSLLIILVVFLLTQLPQSVLSFAQVLADKPYKKTILRKFDDFCDFLSLVNNCISFPAYCICNPQYRKRMRQLCKGGSPPRDAGRSLGSSGYSKVKSRTTAC